MKTEILVIGAGAAGIRAALSAAAEGAQVLLACERPPGESGSSFYPASPPWGMMFAQDEQDAKKFEQEILRSAGPCVNPRLVERLAGEQGLDMSAASLQRLDELWREAKKDADASV